MNVWIYLLTIISLIIILILLVKIYIMRKSAREISTSINNKIIDETNTLIDISSHDRYMSQLANDLNHQLEELYKQRQSYHEGNIELKETITNVSHDLRTPLTAIRAYIDLLKSEEKSDVVSKYIDKIENRTMALAKLTEELFQYTVATSDAENLVFENVILNSILEESISSFYAVIKKSNITPQIEIPYKKIKRKLNKNALTRIFENIISNAVKYSDGDLIIKLQENGVITFSNNASNLTEIQVGKLFERFYTVNTARQSTGLGLSIAKALVEQMNGKISALYENGRVMISVDFSKID